MIEFIYLAHSTDHAGKPMTVRNAIVTVSPSIATRLLNRWSMQGLRSGHRYEPVGFFVYTGDINSLTWETTPVGSYATLSTEVQTSHAVVA